VNELKIALISDECVVVDKPGGMLSVPGRDGRRETRPVVSFALEKQLNRQVFPVHRLDQEVSGALLFAFNANAHRELCQAFEARGVKKVYRALSEKLTELPEGECRWDGKILRGKKRAYDAPHGKDSLTIARCLGVDNKLGQPLSSWELYPHTGRGHQLRFHMARAGFPIVGDELYGSTIPFLTGAIALRSMSIIFPSQSRAAKILGNDGAVRVGDLW
jgi:tRNA pseudouridine32 synthase/23S rRNA pseudouridine746 synthase